jgi:hypothetical protein
MVMLDKRIDFSYIPMTRLKLLDREYYYVGERNPIFTEVFIDGDIEKGEKFVMYLIHGNEVIGFLTCGFNNLHIYLLEAMKLLIFPTAV